MSDVTIYLHVGATKTGTTALQRFLEQNFSKIKDEFGFLYPNFHDKEVFSPMRDGHNYWQGFYFENSSGSEDIETFNRCIDYCKHNSLHSILISHEALLVNWHKRFGDLAGKLDANIKVICYVRRQDHHLESAWKQWGHKFVLSDKIFESLTQQKEEWGGWRQTDWYRLISPWAQIFGKENIIIRPYEKEQMPDGILSDFLEVLKIKWPEQPVLRNEVNVNSGFSRDVLEFLALNRDFYEDHSDQRLHNMMNRVLDESYKKKPFESYGILSPAERLKILKKYDDSNQMVAREFLNRIDGRLFYESWPNLDDAWEPYEGLNTARLVPILTKIMYKLFVRQEGVIRQQEEILKQQNLILSRIDDQHPLTALLKRIYNKLKK